MKQFAIATTGRPRSTHFRAVQKATRIYRIDARTGRIYNSDGAEIGGNTYEPRVTIHLEDRKYNARISKVVAYVVFGPDALRRGVSVVHKDGDKFNNRASNLQLRYSRSARRAATRLAA